LGELIVWTLRDYKEIDPIILSVGEEVRFVLRRII